MQYMYSSLHSIGSIFSGLWLMEGHEGHGVHDTHAYPLLPQHGDASFVRVSKIRWFSVVLIQSIYPLLPFGVCYFGLHQRLLHLIDVLSTRRMADSLGDCLWYTSRTETRGYQR